MGVGQPQGFLLEQFGDVVQAAFGTHNVYHVGSSLGTDKVSWRDVDVRVLLTDEEWEKLGLLDPKESHRDLKWRTLCIVFSNYGRHLTGLPIDFQLQRVKEANEEFPNNRSHLGTKTYQTNIIRSR
jgi:hypothetical protein